MSLLRKIQDAIVDSRTEIATVLRQCAILAVRLGHQGFREWVDRELNGYPEGAELPPYRVIRGVQSIGHFMGPFGEQINNIPLPVTNVPEPLRRRFSHVEFRQGIATLSEMVEGHHEDLISPWPADLIARVADRFIAGRTLMAAHMSIPRSSVIGVIDAVRNRVLQFVLEIEAQAPDAGEAAPGTQPIPQDRVTHMYQTYILGGTNIAVGSSGVTQVALQVQAGDVQSLRRFLTELGVGNDDLNELERALREDGRPDGRRVSSWIGRMMEKAASGAWEIAVPAAANVLTPQSALSLDCRETGPVGGQQRAAVTGAAPLVGLFLPAA